MPVNSSISSRACSKTASNHNAFGNNAFGNRLSRNAAMLVASVMCLCLTASACSSTKAPPKKEGPSAQDLEQRLRRISEAAIVARQATEFPLCPWEKLASTLPDNVGRLVAVGPAAGHTDDDATLMSKATRGYVADGQAVTLELLDSAHSPSVLMAFMLQHAATAQNRDSKSDSGEELKATRIGEHHALTRFNAKSREATVQVMVAQRFLVELRLTPGDNANEALQVASALPLDAIAALDPRTAEPSDAPATEHLGNQQPTGDPDDDSPDQL